MAQYIFRYSHIFVALAYKSLGKEFVHLVSAFVIDNEEWDWLHWHSRHGAGSDGRIGYRSNQAKGRSISMNGISARTPCTRRQCSYQGTGTKAAAKAATTAGRSRAGHRMRDQKGSFRQSRVNTHVINIFMFEVS